MVLKIEILHNHCDIRTLLIPFTQWTTRVSPRTLVTTEYALCVCVCVLSDGPFPEVRKRIMWLSVIIQEKKKRS